MQAQVRTLHPGADRYLVRPFANPAEQRLPVAGPADRSENTVVVHLQV